MATRHEQEFEALSADYFALQNRLCEAHIWSGWETTKVDELASLTREQIGFLFHKIIVKFPQRGGEARTYASEEEALTALNRYQMYLLADRSCRYCKCVTHNIAECPRLRRKIQQSRPCTICMSTYHRVTECPHVHFPHVH